MMHMQMLHVYADADAEITYMIWQITFWPSDCLASADITFPKLRRIS